MRHKNATKGQNRVSFSMIILPYCVKSGLVTHVSMTRLVAGYLTDLLTRVSEDACYVILYNKIVSENCILEYDDMV